MRSRFLVTRFQLYILMKNISNNRLDKAQFEIENILAKQCVGTSDEIIDTDVENTKVLFNKESKQMIDTKEKINSYSHVYLYAKHWYKRTDPIVDMKILIGKRSEIDPIYISVSDIVGQLTDLVWLSITRSGNPSQFFEEFVNDITFNQERWKYGAYENDKQEVVVINKCLSVLSITEKNHIDGELAEPDPNILPLAEEDGLQRFREMNRKTKC